MKTLSVISTVYYNAESLLIHAEAMKEQRDILRKTRNMNMELIYVNDGSGDDSLEILKTIKSRYPDWVTVVSLTRNFGAMNAVSASLNYITGDCLIILACDMQDPPDLIPKIVDSWLEGNLFTIAVRSSRKDPFFTTLFSKIFNFLARKLIIKTYPKGGYDLFLLDKQFFSVFKQRAKNFNVQLYCYWIGVKPKIIFFDRLQRLYGKSRWTFRKKFKLLIDSFIGFSSAPIKIVAGVGLGVSMGSFLYGLVIFINAILGRIPVPGYATIICLISFLLSLIIFMLALVAEYLVRIYDEVSNKPQYVIEEVL